MNKAMQLEKMPHYQEAMQRIAAWLEGEDTDRVPIRFSRHNEDYEKSMIQDKNIVFKEQWFNTELRISSFLSEYEHGRFNGETFPVFFPNLGPNLIAAGYGCHCEFEESTVWAEPIDRANALTSLCFDFQNEYLKKVEELTAYSLMEDAGRWITGYSDFHPGLDCLAACLGVENLCYVLIEQPENVMGALWQIQRDFGKIYDHFDNLLKKAGQPSVTWMDIPVEGRLHIPSCDFASMISQEMFDQFAFPVLEEEMKSMTHNIFHLDGKGVAVHIDSILKLPKLNAIQWVQGVGDDLAIMQWIPLIKKIQAAGVGVVIDLQPTELETFICEMSPKGIFLCIPTESYQMEKAIIKRLEKWH